MFTEKEIDKVSELLKPTFTLVASAKDKEVVAVLGATGDGKSTLLNYLHGCDYEKFTELGLGFKRPKLISTSIPEICPVGNNYAKSETRYPKLIQSNEHNWLYCDLPGFFDSGTKEEDLCAAIAPEILRKSAKSIKGLVWVLSVQQLLCNRAEHVKKMLKYFIEISNNDPTLIANSLCIVCTKAKKGTSAQGILKVFKSIKKEITDDNEKKLLSLVIQEMEKNSIKVIISDVFDGSGKNRELINDVVSHLNPPSNPFDFSKYSKKQKNFNKYLIDSAKFYIDQKNLEKESLREISDAEKQINVKKQNLKLLVDKLYFHKGQLEKSKNKKEDSQLERRLLMEKISKIENKKIRKELSLKVEAEIEPGYERVANSLIDFNSRPAMENYYATISAIQRNGNSYRNQHLYGHTHAVYEIVAPKPKVGEAQKKLSFIADYPVTVIKRSCSEGAVILPDTEKNTKGYEAMIKYPRGKGVNTTITIEMEYKNTPEGKSELLKLKESLKILNDEIAAEQKESNNSKSLKDQCEEQKAELEKEIDLLEKKKIKCTDKVNEIKKNLEKRKDFFDSICKVSKVLQLDLVDQTVKQFISMFATQQVSSLTLFGKSSTTTKTATGNASKNFQFTPQ